MTVAMIMSKDRLDQEHAMLNRLVVGLANDGIQVIRIVPTTPNDELDDFEKAVSLAKRISTPMPISRLLRNTRREEILFQLDKIEVDSIVAFGNEAEKVAIDIAPELNAPILREVVSMRAARRIRKSSKVWRWLAATPSIESVIAKRVGEDRVSLVPLAAATSHAVPINTAMNTTKSNRCISILDAASNPKATRKILEAVKDTEDIHIFLELIGHNQHKIWKQVLQLDMLDRVTCLRDMAALRTLIVQTDLVLLPSPSMQVRTILLEVMLASIPIIATTIEGFDMLIDEETAIIVDEDWSNAIDLILQDSHFASRIGDAGANLITEQYASSAQIVAFEASFTLI